MSYDSNKDPIWFQVHHHIPSTIWIHSDKHYTHITRSIVRLRGMSISIVCRCLFSCRSVCNGWRRRRVRNPIAGGKSIETQGVRLSCTQAVDAVCDGALSCKVDIVLGTTSDVLHTSRRFYHRDFLGRFPRKRGFTFTEY